MKNNTSFLKGSKCKLDPIQIRDISVLANLLSKWINDEVVTFYMFTGQFPIGKSEIVNNIKRDMSGDNIIFLIRRIKTNKIIGYCGLYDINKTARKAEFRVLIGDNNCWGKGIGTEVCQMVTFYGFDRVNLNRIYLGYTSANKAAAKVYVNAGYVYEGTLKDDIYRNSGYYDTELMAILRDDFYKKYYNNFANKYKPSINK